MKDIVLFESGWEEVISQNPPKILQSFESNITYKDLDMFPFETSWHPYLRLEKFNTNKASVRRMQNYANPVTELDNREHSSTMTIDCQPNKRHIIRQTCANNHLVMISLRNSQADHYQMRCKMLVSLHTGCCYVDIHTIPSEITD